MNRFMSSVAVVIGILLGLAVCNRAEVFAASCKKGCADINYCFRVVGAQLEDGYACVEFDGPQCAAITWYPLSDNPEESWTCVEPDGFP